MMIKSKFLLSTFAAAALSIAATSASAATYALGTLSNNFSYTDVIYQPKSSTSFSDLFTFTVPTNFTADLSAFVKDLSIPGILNIAKLKLELEDSSLLPVSGVGNNTHQTYTDLASGNYRFEVTGKSKGYFGGSYLAHMSGSLSPVPEPATYAMVLAGLGLVGVMARRRGSSI